LLKKAISLDAGFVATGHYARIEFDRTRRRYLLKKGYDLKKDQSYVLYMMTQTQLEHTLMPLGTLTKEKVRELARQWKLGIADKAESQEICFIPNNNYGEYLQEYLPRATKPGPIFDKEGKILGEHKGILFYTIGQRKRMGIAVGEPLYVIAIDRERNAIIVGREEDVYTDELIASEVNYIDRERLTRSLKVTGKIRYRAKEAEAVITPEEKDKVQVEFIQPQRAIAPGQAVVFYKKDTVVGGGTILR
jgi:tRNA-specific 2-thiouridylase